MILFVRVETRQYYENSNGDFALKRLFEKLSGEPCLVLHVSQISPERIHELQPKALLFSGVGTWFRDFEVRDFYPLEEVVKACDLPTIGFCGSHQLFGFAFNEGFRNLEKVIDEPMRSLQPHEPDLGGGAHAGLFLETGFWEIFRVQEDPLFAGLPDPFIMRESHYCEIKRLPEEFVLLATNENCRVQAMRHRDRLLYGTQFHPEAYVEAYPHGRILLQNFFRLAGLKVEQGEQTGIWG